MMKITTKTKKEDLINVAMEMNLFQPNCTRESIDKDQTAKSLYLMIKQATKATADTPDSTVESDTAQNTPTALNNAEEIQDKPIEKVDVVTPANNESSQPPQSDNIEKQATCVCDDSGIVAEIVDRMNTITEAYTALNIKFSDLQATNKKLTDSIGNKKRHDCSVYNEYVDMMNKVANTKDPNMVWVWNMLNEFSKKLNRDKNDTIILDINKLIIQDKVREREEKELRDRLEEQNAKAMYDEVTYDSGVHINYIDGKPCCVVGIKKSVYKKYVDWYNYCLDWVEYILDSISIANKSVVKSVKKNQLKELKVEVDSWYETWADYVDADTIALIKETVVSLFEDLNKDKAMSNFVAIVDEFEV